MKHVTTEELYYVRYILKDDEELNEESIPFDSERISCGIVDVADIDATLSNKMIRAANVLGT